MQAFADTTRSRWQTVGRFENVWRASLWRWLLDIDSFVVGEETFVGAQCKTFIQAVVDGRIGLDEVFL